MDNGIDYYIDQATLKPGPAADKYVIPPWGKIPELPLNEENVSSATVKSEFRVSLV